MTFYPSAGQPADADLTSIAALGTAADKSLYTTAANTWAEMDVTAAGRAILDDATAAAQRTTLGAQASDATLTSIAALGTAADKLAYTTGVDTWAEAPLTAFARTVLDDADAAAVRVTIGAAAAYQPPKTWYVAALGAFQTDSVLTANGSGAVGITKWRAPAAGTITTIATFLNGTITAGNMSVDIRKNDTQQEVNMAHSSAVKPTGGTGACSVAVAVDDRIDLTYTTDAGFLPTGSVTMEVTLRFLET